MKIIKINNESKLKEIILSNFSKYFDFNFVDEEYRITGGIIDIVGKDENTIYIVELKRDFVTNKTIEQLTKYLESYDPGDYDLVGIACAPKVASNIDFSALPHNVMIRKLEDFKFAPDRVPYSAMIDEYLKENLAKLSKETRIPQSKLLDEALEDLFNKYDNQKGS